MLGIEWTVYKFSYVENECTLIMLLFVDPNHILTLDLNI